MNQANHCFGDYLQLLKSHQLVLQADTGLALSTPIQFVSCDSRTVVNNSLFICKGAHFDVSYLQMAKENGAVAYVSEVLYESVGLPCVLVSDVRLAMAEMASYFYNDPSHRLHVIGITGTKGKSSTTYYMKYILDEYLMAHKKEESAVISSINTYDGKQRFESHLTTPEPLELQGHFNNALTSDIEYLTMEVSSQALKYDRVRNVDFAATVFLNIGMDHISPIEHPDFEDYLESKLKIFRQGAAACVNLDCEYADRVLAAAKRDCKRVITFSQKDASATVYASQVKKSGNDIVFRVKTPAYHREFRLTMPGLFNVENALASLAVCEALGISEQYAYAGLMKARVPGRMEIYQNANEHVTAIVDYAHNKLSFETLFDSVRKEYPDRKIITVFGCPGKKAFDRRRDLGEISGKYSDLVILTEEDAGEEPILDICKDIAQYVEAVGGNYTIEPDRGEAIYQAVMASQTPSVLLITGKGAETRQKRGVEYIDCPSDVAYVQEALEEYDKIHGMDGMSKVRALLQTLPLLRRYAGKTLVVKYGGSAIGAEATESILEDVSALQAIGAKVILVHGGGKEISALLKKLEIQTQFVDGYRVTNEEVVELAEMALTAKVNQKIVGRLARFGALACGVSGRDGKSLVARQKDPTLGRVGEISHVNTELFLQLQQGGFLPVVSPIAQDEQGLSYNCNADDVASMIAKAVKADELIFLTDTSGILVDKDNQSTKIANLTAKHAKNLIEEGLIAGGMIPKTNNAICAVEKGVKAVTILDGSQEHILLLDAVSERSLGTKMTQIDP